MGLFNDVIYAAPCPSCGTQLTGWQTKDGDVWMRRVTPLEMWHESEVKFPTFYTGCRECKMWIDISVGWMDNDAPAREGRVKKDPCESGDQEVQSGDEQPQVQPHPDD